MRAARPVLLLLLPGQLSAQFQDPGFEQANNHWNFTCPDAGGFTGSDAPNGGNYCAQVPAVSSTQPDCYHQGGPLPFVFQQVPGINNGDALTVSFWQKCIPTPPAVIGDMQVMVVFGWWSPPTVGYSDFTPCAFNWYPAYDTWTQTTVSCTLQGVPQGAVPAVFLGGQAVNQTTGFVQFDNATLTVNAAAVQLSAKAWLDGAYDSNTGLMRDDLRTLQRIPALEPNSVNYCCTGGGETVAPTVLQVSGNNAVVDWVRLELRTGDAQNSQLVSVRHALLQRDGDIVDVNGSSPVSFPVGAGAYWVVLRHRNHLAVMTAAPVQLSVTPTTLDFRAPTTACYTRPSPNSDAPRRTVGSTRTLWTGNITADDRVKYAGAGNDRDALLVLLGGQPNTVNASYTVHDVNLDGFAKYTGSGNDRDPILITVGSTTPNGVRIQQVP